MREGAVKFAVREVIEMGHFPLINPDWKKPLLFEWNSTLRACRWCDHEGY